MSAENDALQREVGRLGLELEVAMGEMDSDAAGESEEVRDLWKQLVVVKAARD